MYFRSFGLILIAFFFTTFHCAAQTIPQNLKTWTLEYSVVGGIAGLDQHLWLTEAGELSVGNSEGRGSHVTTHASVELTAKIAEFLRIAKRTQPPAPSPIPDRMDTSLTLTSAGANYTLDLPADIAKLFSDTMGAVLKNAFVGTWWQSGWKLCSPSTQLTAADIDVPIESLMFESDGRFSVTWRGGGARGYLGGAVPHVAIPDYVGRYTIVRSSYIHMSYERGIYTPRDFSGDGTFQLNGDKLDLQNIWLGTKLAKKRPDICELEFTRTSEPADSPERERTSEPHSTH